MEQVDKITQLTETTSPLVKLGRLVKEAVTYTTSAHSQRKEWPLGSWVCDCGKLLAKPNGDGAVAGQIKCKGCGAINER